MITCRQRRNERSSYVSAVGDVVIDLDDDGGSAALGKQKLNWHVRDAKLVLLF